MDFVIFDMDDNNDVPLSVGKPFLATSKAILEFENDRITFQTGRKNVSFYVFKPTSYPKHEWWHVDKGRRMKGNDQNYFGGECSHQIYPG